VLKAKTLTIGLALVVLLVTLWPASRLGSEFMPNYNDARTHLSLNKEAPASRAVQAAGRITAVPHFGGLHHQYVRI
jgi:Cu/Ag efflux pump CusA